MIDACPESAVLFFDVDGTLTSFDPDDMTDKDFNAVHPSKAVVDAFGRLRNAGHQAFICTGRPLWLIADGLRALEPAGVVAMAGATLEVEGRVVHEDCFDEDVVEELARRMAAAGIEAFFETNVATFALEPAGVEQSSLIGTSVVHSAEEMARRRPSARRQGVPRCAQFGSRSQRRRLYRSASLSCATPVVGIES